MKVALDVMMSETVVVCVMPPPVPVTVIVYVPVAALLPTVSVKVDEPDPGAAMLVGLKLAVAPFGRPLAERVTALSNPPETEELIVEVPVPP